MIIEYCLHVVGTIDVSDYKAAQMLRGRLMPGNDNSATAALKTKKKFGFVSNL